jgi:mRNA interferase MazF
MSLKWMYTILMIPPKPSYKRGDVVLVLFPNSNLRTAKLRPGIIVQTDNLKTGLNQFVISMISSNMRRAGHPSRVAILVKGPVGKQSGLLTDSVVMTDNLATVEIFAIQRLIGTLAMKKVNAALRHTLGL